MTNHDHLLVETSRANLGQALNWVNASYAAYFNRKRRRQGHLFQERDKDTLVDADTSGYIYWAWEAYWNLCLQELKLMDDISIHLCFFLACFSPE